MEGPGFGKGYFKPDASLVLGSWRYRTGAAAPLDRKNLACRTLGVVL